MKITFIDPPNFLEKRNVERVFGCTYSLYPIPNIFSLSNAAYLQRQGYEAAYIDMANEGWPPSKVRDFFTNDRSDAYVFYSVNLSIEPDLFVCGILRKARPDAPVVFTGPAPTYFRERFLKDPRCVTVRGETEETLAELARALTEGRDPGEVKGVSFLRDGVIIDNPPRPLIEDLDALPFPARGLLKKELYYNPKLYRKPFTAMQTSRNCPYRCIFCVPNSSSFAAELEYRKYHADRKPPVRLRSKESIVEEFTGLAREGYRSVSIIDDQFLWGQERALDICDGIRDLGIEWGCLARADKVTEALAKRMKASGCAYVDLGVESFAQEVLDDIRKDVKAETLHEAIAILKRNGILTKINLMLGVSSLQTEEVIRRDIAIAKKLDVDAVMFSIATPFPGTEFYRRAEEAGLFAGSGYRAANVQSRSIVGYPHLSRERLDVLVRQANLYFYLSPRFLVKNMTRLFRGENLYYSLVALKRKLFR